MIFKIVYFNVLGIPLIYVLGILAFIALISTFTIGFAKSKGKFKKLSFKWHSRFAILTLFLALIHVIMAILVRL